MAKNRIIIYPIILIILIFAGFFTSPKLTALVINDENLVDIPNILDGEEINHLRYKYSNTSGIILSTPSYISCNWKAPKDDDGYKVCEIIFEVDDDSKESKALSSPNIDLSFINNKNIRNIEISYSKEFNVIEEVHEELKAEEVELTSNKENTLSEAPKTLITGQVIQGSSEEDTQSSKKEKRISSRSSRTRIILDHRQEVINKRDFENFFEFEPINGELEINISKKNKTINENKTIQEVKELQGELNKTLNYTRVSISEDEPKNRNNESENLSLKEETIKVDAEFLKSSEEIQKTIKEQPTEERSTTGLLTGLITSPFKEDHSSIDSSKPFAVKVRFEIPKYEENQFDFRISDNGFDATIDPDVSGCGTLNSKGATYTLTGNINSSGTCFTITANNVTLDCRGASLTYSTSAQGYAVYSIANYTKILNCNIYDGNDSVTGGGVNILNGNYLNISNSNLEISSQFGFGIYLDTSEYAHIENNTIQVLKGDSNALYLSSSSKYANISQNNITISGEVDQGIFLSDSSDYSYIFKNDILATAGEDYTIFIDSSKGHRILENIISTREYESYGIYSEYGSNSSIENNTIKTLEIDSNAIYLIFGSDDIVFKNLVNTSGQDSIGINMEDNPRSNIIGNNVYTYGVQGHAIDIISNSENNILNENNLTTSGSSSYGISLTEESNFANLANNKIITSGTSSSGLVLSDSSNSVIESLTINTSNTTSHGISFNTFSSNNSFSNIDTVTSGSGSNAVFILNQNPYFSFQDSVFNTLEGSAEDFYISSLVNGGVWNFTNSSIPKVNWGVSANGTLNPKWYVDITTNNSNGSIVKNINVSAWNSKGGQVFSILTNSSGESRQIVQEYLKTNFTNKTIYSNFTINASTTLENLSLEINLTENKKVIFTFGESEGSGVELGSSEEGSSGGGSSTLSCKDKWECTGWSECTEGKRTRECEDKKPYCNQGKEPKTEEKCKIKKKTLFDINLELIDEYINPTGKILTKIRLLNIGVPGRVNASLSYQIINSNKETVYAESEIIVVETQTEFVKEFKNLSLEDGKYKILVTLEYEGQTEPAMSIGTFVVGSGEEPIYLRLIKNTFIIVILILLISGFLIFKFLKRNKREIKEEGKTIIQKKKINFGSNNITPLTSKTNIQINQDKNSKISLMQSKPEKIKPNLSTKQNSISKEAIKSSRIVNISKKLNRFLRNKKEI